MVSEYQPIVDVITRLQSNALKDYILPVGTIAASVLVGFKAAKYAVSYQEDVKGDIAKIKILNRVIMDANAMRISLLTRKNTYFNKLPANPILRVFAILPTLGEYYAPKLDEVNLCFISSHLNSKNRRWCDPIMVHALFTNYKSLNIQWEYFYQKRAEIEPIIEDYALDNIGRDEMLDGIGHVNLMKLTNQAEMVIKETDERLVELTCFCIAFPYFAKNLVSKEAQKKHGEIISIELPTAPEIVDLLSPCMPLDIEVMAEIQGRAVDEIKHIYQPTFS